MKPTDTTKINVLLADDDDTVRAYLRDLIQEDQDMEIVGEAQNGEQAVQLAARLQPDVIVMDLNMPVMNGIDATRRILAENPDAKVLMLSMRRNSQFVEAAMSAGVRKYLAKDADFEDLIAAIRSVASEDATGD